MPAERFFIDAELSGTVHLEGQEHHHLAHVMRIREGEIIELVNGRGALAQAKVLLISKPKTSLEILEIKIEPLPLPKLFLAIPYLRMSKLEWVIEKGTELGADAFYLYPADYSEKGDFSPHQLQRLTHIAISALKQSGRLDLPKIELQTLDKLLALPCRHYFGDTREEASSLRFEFPALFITGPERGFSPDELLLLESKALGVKLHRNILRAETAPLLIAALSSSF